MELFLNYFIKLYDKSCSEIRHLQNNRIKSQLPFTKNIKIACKKNKNYILNSLMTKVLKILFDTKKYKNKLTSIIRKCKKNYYTHLLYNSKTIKNTWSILNSIINQRKPNLLKITININRKGCSDSTISNKMNYHFTQIGNKLADKIDDIPNKSFHDYLNNRHFNSMVLSTISACEIYLAINNFKTKVYRDELDISMKLIQEISSSIIMLCNYSSFNVYF